MANRPKSQGTGLESEVREAARTRGLPAQRYESGAPARDVDIDSHLRWVVECKHRANLNAHKTVLQSINAWPDWPVMLVWKRLSRKDGNERRTADGPTLACLPYGDLLDLLALARDVDALRDVDLVGCVDDELASIVATLLEHLDGMAARYPAGRI